MPSVRGVVKGSFPWFMVASSRSHPQTPASPADGPRGWSVTPEPKWPCLRNSDAEGKCPNPWQWKHMPLLGNSEALWPSSRQRSLMSTIPIGKLKKKVRTLKKGHALNPSLIPNGMGNQQKKGPLAFPPGRYSLQVKQKKAQRKYTYKIRPTQTKKESPPKEQGHPSSEETSCFEPNLQI